MEFHFEWKKKPLKCGSKGGTWSELGFRRITTALAALLPVDCRGLVLKQKKIDQKLLP